MANKGYIDYDIKGLKEVQKALLALPETVRKRVASTAMRNGAKVVLKEAQGRMSYGTKKPFRTTSDMIKSNVTGEVKFVGKGKTFGYARKAPHARDTLVIRKIRKSNLKKMRADTGYRVGVDKKEKTYWHMYTEFGTSTHIVKNFLGIKHFQMRVGGVPAKPWLRPAFDTTHQQQLGAISRSFKRLFERQVKLGRLGNVGAFDLADNSEG